MKSSGMKYSWMDHVLNWIDGLPIPGYFLFILLYVVLVYAYHQLLWIEGELAPGTLSAHIIVQNVWFVFIVGAWQLLRSTANSALDRFRMNLTMDEKSFEELRRSFLYLGPGTGWFLAIFGLLMPLLMPLLFPTFIRDYMGTEFFSQNAQFITWPIMVIITPMNFGAYIFLFRSLSQIPTIYEKVDRINLFNLAPLNSLSSYTFSVALVSIAFGLINLLSAPVYSDGTSSQILLFYFSLSALMGLLAIFLPVLGIHNRLVAEKAKVTLENSQRLESSFFELQQCVDTKQLEGIGDLRNSIATLLDFRNEMNKVPTWPWNPGTLRNFGTALLIPLTVWFFQQVAGRVI